MNKTELSAHVAGAAGITRAEADKAVDAVLTAISAALGRDEDVTLVGFGAFTTESKPARQGRNPRTGAAIEIPACRAPKFRAGKGLKEAVNV
ncbi:MAG: HU family DNA-binding protein [Rhodospirillaceae bacterium]